MKSHPSRSRTVLALALPILFGAPVLTHAEDGPWLLRARLLDMRPENQNSDTPAAFQSLGPVEAQSKVFPEVDFSYFFDPHWAAELILTYPQAHTVTLGGNTIGSLKHLPPVLTLQYHFLPAAPVQPYVGVGLNYTRFFSVDLLGGAVVTDKDSVGLAAQAGVDIPLSGPWSLNLDAKYVEISTHVKLAASGATITKLGINPWLLSVGIGYHF